MKSAKQLLSENRDFAEEMFRKIDKKMSVVTKRSRNKLADGVDGQGIHKSTRPENWTSGFWPGLNYLLYERTKNPDYLETARGLELAMDKGLEKFDTLSHDVGFMWHIVSVTNYRLSGDEASRRRALFAAATLSSRFILGGNFIRAWNEWDPPVGNEGWTIIDCLMNLPILYFASAELRDDRFKRIAMAHADMALRDHLRPDGSVAHIVEHNRETGEAVRTYGGQGIREGSSWSRGQAWALYGFVLSYLHTGEMRYLDGAKQVANYFISNCCDDWLPRIDFRAPAEPVYYDSTAGACAACGLIELAKALPEDEGGMYMNAAVNILRAMGERFMDFSEETDCMLNFGSVRYPTSEFSDDPYHISIIYGDYFYTEAILKLIGSEFQPWLI